MAAKNKAEYKGFEKGDICVRKGRLCVITKINWDITPPDVTVKMQDTGDIVGTEFSRLERPSDEDMLKMPMSKPQSNNNRKRSYFDTFFEERKKKYSSKSNSNSSSNHNHKNIKCNNIPQITSNLNNNTNKNKPKTFEDLLLNACNNNNGYNEYNSPPKKRTKLSHHSPQGWCCNACTVENPDMDGNKCYLCGTGRTFEEKIKYPNVNPIIVSNDNKENDNNDNNDEKKEDNNNANININEIRFMTWNVWFNEELQVIERMNAIGNIINKHAPDIICFQEITPLILDIFQNSEWYKMNGYTSTRLPTHGSFEGFRYFNVIMTKHEFLRDSIEFKLFDNTQMGRHLIITPIKINNKIIYSATTHLESPVGQYMGGKKDKFSKERKEQLKYSIETLDKLSNNIIFGGDFNWCKPSKNYENDGDIKRFLGNNWIDCYNKLHPNDNGYTYDAKTNGMLTGYLCNRLDRIVYKNNGNLKLKSCQMIGREAIPNLNYVKTIKRKNGDEQKILPVLPSDHYGLFATFDVV